MFVEKYRPTSWEEFECREDIKLKLKNLKLEDCPHLLFCGRAGVGKTTVTYILARQFYGEEYKLNVMELNASDQRGIDTIREKVKMFCKTVTMGGKRKLLILDEADALTTDAQHALRRMMEKFYKNVVFVLTANYSNKIIEPIKSRCMQVDLLPLNEENIKKVLVRIAEKENLNIENINNIVKLSEGDVRKAINTMEGGVIQKIGDVDVLMKNIIDGKIGEAKKEMDEMLKTSEEALVLNEMFEWVLKNSQKIPTKIKAELALLFAKYDYQISVAKHPYIQLFSVMIETARMFRGDKNEAM